VLVALIGLIASTLVAAIGAVVTWHRVNTVEKAGAKTDQLQAAWERISFLEDRVDEVEHQLREARREHDQCRRDKLALELEVMRLRGS
jgi:chromosome segregation ATPase